MVRAGIQRLRAMGRTRAGKSSFLQSVLTLAGGTAIGQALMVAVAPFLTRLYTPDDFGKYGLFITFAAVAGVATSLRYESAIVSARNPDEATDLALLSLGLASLMSLVATLCLYFMITLNVLGYGSLPFWSVALAFPSLVLSGFFLALRYRFIGDHDFAIVTRTGIMQNIFRAGGQLLLGLLQLGWAGLMIGEVLGRAGGLSQMVQKAGPPLGTRLRQGDLQAIGQTIRYYYKFPVYSLPSSMLDMVVIMLPLPLISQLYGPTAAGYFTLVQRVMALPLSLIGNSFADAFHGHVATITRDTPHETRAFFLRTARSLVLIGLLPALILAFLGPVLFGLIFGSEWTTAGALAAAIAPWSFAQLVVGPLSRIVFVLRGQELKLIYDVAALAATLAGLYGAHAYGFSLLDAVTVLNWLQVVAYGIYFIILLRIASSATKGS